MPSPIQEGPGAEREKDIRTDLRIDWNINFGQLIKQEIGNESGFVAVIFHLEDNLT